MHLSKKPIKISVKLKPSVNQTKLIKRSNRKRKAKTVWGGSFKRLDGKINHIVTETSIYLAIVCAIKPTNFDMFEH